MTTRETNKKIRAINLKNIIDNQFGGNVTKFAKDILNLSSDKKPTEIYMYLSFDRLISDKKAAFFENTLKLPYGYLDIDHTVKDDKDLNTFLVPEYDVKLSAGKDGAEVIEANIIRYHTINETFLTEFRVKKENLAVVQVIGDSMESTLRAGERVVIDKSRKDIIDNRVFAITTQGNCWVKRVRLTPSGNCWMSDNQDYQQYDKDLNNGNLIRIEGLVLYSLGREIL